MATLSEPLKIGALQMRNRVVMSPLTRCRAPGRVPNALMVEYYRQRAGAGLIIAEATAVTPMGVGYPDTPGIWSTEQVAGWKPVTKAVHEAGGLIVLQLWHVGRISDPIYLNGALPVAPSAIAAEGHVSQIRPKKPYVTPRALETAEIPGIVEDYRKGSENALEAGFDGVEIHGANGYLPDQFLQDSVNRRTDEYGGPVENRAKLLLGATDAAISVFGADRVGVHLAPRMDSHTMGDSDPEGTFGYVARQLGARRIAFIFTREGIVGRPRLSPMIKREFGGALIVNEGFTRESATELLQRGEADAVAWGKQFIANPDLPKRLFTGAPLNAPDADSFYARGVKGYTDYPFLSA
ncbi:MAG: alkene reductase [Opitutales bacterium]|jgi:2,4-dienoyl-CoA reductase-like NADH-dependent reductase (Old Yellow Enzyme family)